MDYLKQQFKGGCLQEASSQESCSSCLCSVINRNRNNILVGQIVKPNTKPSTASRKKASIGPHYNVNMKAIDVNGKFLTLPTNIFDTTSKTGTIIDSGTTLSYLPDAAHSAVMSEIMGQRYIPQESQGFMCFQYTANVDDGFPIITFHFENSLTLKVYPHDYLFELQDDLWCFGFQSSTSQSNEKNYFLLGDLVLSNKLVFYDIENQAIGWTEYNCSSSISVQDDRTGVIYKVGAHTISFTSMSDPRRALFLLALTAFLHYFVSR